MCHDKEAKPIHDEGEKAAAELRQWASENFGIDIDHAAASFAYAFYYGQATEVRIICPRRRYSPISFLPPSAGKAEAEALYHRAQEAARNGGFTRANGIHHVTRLHRPKI